MQHLNPELSFFDRRRLTPITTWVQAAIIALTAWAATSGWSSGIDTDLSKGYRSGDWALSLRLKWEQSEKRDDAILIITIQNLSDIAQLLGEHPILVDYHIHVFDETGREIPYNAHGAKEAAYPHGWKVLMKTLKPNDRLVYHANLTQYFDLPRGRPYTLKVRRYLTLLNIPRGAQMPPDEGVRLEYVDATPIRLDWKN